MAEARLEVDIFVRQIHAAGEGDAPVNDGDFPVVAVVVEGGDEGPQGREHLAADAESLHLLRIAVGDSGKSAHAVVHHAHLHPLAHLLLQHLQDPAPHLTVVDDEVLEENEMLRAEDGLQQRGEFLLAAGVILGGGVVIDRAADGALSVGGETPEGGILVLQPFHDRALVRKEGRSLPDRLG